MLRTRTHVVVEEDDDSVISTTTPSSLILSSIFGSRSGFLVGAPSSMLPPKLIISFLRESCGGGEGSIFIHLHGTSNNLMRLTDILIVN